MRSHNGTSNLACIAKAAQSQDHKTITVSLEHAPSGEPMLYVPSPGGHMKFHIVHDSMTRPERLPSERYNLPNNAPPPPTTAT